MRLFINIIKNLSQRMLCGPLLHIVKRLSARMSRGPMLQIGENLAFLDECPASCRSFVAIGGSTRIPVLRPVTVCKLVTMSLWVLRGPIETILRGNVKFMGAYNCFLNCKVKLISLVSKGSCQIRTVTSLIITYSPSHIHNIHM